MKATTIIKTLFNEFRVGKVGPSFSPMPGLRVYAAKLKGENGLWICRFHEETDSGKVDSAQLSVFPSIESAKSDFVYNAQLLITADNKTDSIDLGYNLRGTPLNTVFPFLLSIQARAFQLIQDDKVRTSTWNIVCMEPRSRKVSN